MALFKLSLTQLPEESRCYEEHSSVNTYCMFLKCRLLNCKFTYNKEKGKHLWTGADKHIHCYVQLLSQTSDLLAVKELVNISGLSLQKGLVMKNTNLVLKDQSKQVQQHCVRIPKYSVFEQRSNNGNKSMKRN